jgi:ribonuclease HI/probable phosphoglycerate mutase
MEQKSVKLFSDGACRGNPGPGGGGAVITDAADRILWEGREYFGRCTNNIAEYKALILGLKGALACGCKNIDIYLDSELLANQINGSYKVKNENLKILMQDVRKLLSSLESAKVRHVPRCRNATADRLANRAIDEHVE